jgi:hypothetical protein
LDGQTLVDEVEGLLAEKEVELHLPPEGIEIRLEAQWPAGTPDTAATLNLEPDGMDARSETRWSAGQSMDEVIPFVWKS